MRVSEANIIIESSVARENHHSITAHRTWFDEAVCKSLPATGDCFNYCLLNISCFDHQKTKSRLKALRSANSKRCMLYAVYDKQRVCFSVIVCFSLTELL